LGSSGLGWSFCDAAADSGAFEQVFGRLEFSGVGTELFKRDGLRSQTSVVTLGVPAPTRVARMEKSVRRPGVSAALEPTLRKDVIEALLRDPGDALPRLRLALFADTLGIPVANAIQALRQLEVALASGIGQIQWSRG